MQVFNEEIVTKWKVEALTEPSLNMTERMFSYCINELRHKSKLFREMGTVTAYDADVVKSDNAIPSSLKMALRAAVAPLEDIPAFYRDWHPGSNETVLDLVHPSLFPVIYGKTKILSDSFVGLDYCIKRCGEGEILNAPEAGTQPRLSHLFSCNFQWLPCEVKFDGDRMK